MRPRNSRAGAYPIILAATMAACSRNAVPTTEDIPDIMAEAQGTREVSKWRDSEARRAVRSAFKTMLYFDSVHTAEVARRFATPELRSYLMLSDSYVGGDFPRRTAVYLREVQQSNQQYLQLVQTFRTILSDKLATTDIPADRRQAITNEMAQAYDAQQKPVIRAVAAVDTFVQHAAVLYELAASRSGAFQSMRTGLEISDGAVLQRFNQLVDRANHAHEVADSAIRRLPADQQTRFRAMGVATPLKRQQR